MLKKFLSLLLVCLMAVSLAACGDKDVVSGDESTEKRGSHVVDSSEVEDSEKVLEDTDGVTAESLIESGYGVGIGVPESATLYFDFTIQEGSRSRTIECLHQYDGDYDHMVVVSQYDEDGSEVPIEYEFYYSYADSTVYQSSNGEVVSGTAERFECGLTKCITVPVSVMMSEPILQETDNEYTIKGKCSADLFNDMLSFVYDDAATFEGDVDFGLVYDKETLELTGMIWYATSGITEYQVVAAVMDVNDTVVTFGETSTDVTHDGALIAEVLYGTDYVYEDEISSILGSEYDWMDEEVLFQYRYFCNFYSADEFVEYLTESRFVSEDEQKAAVVVCKLLDLPMNILYDDGYMTQEFAEIYWNK